MPTRGKSRISHWGPPTPLEDADVQHGHFLAKTFAEMKELGPVDGRGLLGTSAILPEIGLMGAAMLWKMHSVQSGEL